MPRSKPRPTTVAEREEEKKRSYAKPAPPSGRNRPKSARAADDPLFIDRPWLFRPGSRPAGGGRAPGVPNKSTMLLKDSILYAASCAGDDLKKLIIERMRKEKADEIAIQDVFDNDAGGLVGYLKWLALEHPSVFGPLVGKVLPMQIQVQKSEVVTYRSIEEIDKELAARRIPVRRLAAAINILPVPAATPPVTEPDPASAGTDTTN